MSGLKEAAQAALEALEMGVAISPFDKIVAIKALRVALAAPQSDLVSACVERVRATEIIEGECPARMREAIAQRVADVGKGTFQVQQPQPEPELLKCDIEPRPLSHPLRDYHIAISEGPLNYTWQDKPHRLVYDLIAAVRYYAALQAQQPQPEPVKGEAFALRGHIRTLRLAGRDDGMVEDMERVAIALEARQTQLQPKAWGVFNENGFAHIYQSRETADIFGKSIPLYAASQASASPLTDEQIWQHVGTKLDDSMVKLKDVLPIARAIERAHGIVS